MASHDNLRFSAVRLSTQTHKPDGPIQQFELCLHDDWQSTPDLIRIHLLGSNADALLATTGLAIALPVRGEEHNRFMVVDTHESDQDESEDLAPSRQRLADNDTSWQTQGDGPKSRTEVDERDRDRLPSPEVANFIVGAGLIRLYHDPYETHEASLEPLSTTTRRLTVVNGLTYLVCFVCGAAVAWIVLLVLAGTEREDVFIDAANRTININLNYVSVRRAILLGNEALLNNPIEYGALLFDVTRKSWHSSMSTTRRRRPNHAHVHPLFVLNSAGHFVPEFYFFQDLLVVLSHIKQDFATLSGSHWTTESDSFLDRAELTVYELQRLHAAAEGDLTLAWGPRSVESITHCFRRLGNTLPHGEHDDDTTDGIGHPNRWIRLWDRWSQDPRVIHLRHRWDHDPLVNHVRQRWSRKPPSANTTNEQLHSVFTKQPFPGIFSPAMGGHGAASEHLIGHLARKLSTTLLYMHRIVEHAEKVTADMRVLPIDNATMASDADNEDFAAARVHSTLCFFREVALPRLLLLEENVRAGLGLLRNVLLAQYEMAFYLAESPGAGVQMVYPKIEVMMAGVKKARDWIMLREISGVDAEFRALQAPFHSARRSAIETSNATNLPPNLIYSRFGLGDNRSDPYGAERLVWEARVRSKRGADTIEEGNVTRRKRRRLWFWEIR